MSVFVFDLDDTLYNEMDYVQSGFNAVSEYLSLKFGISKTDLLQDMNNELRDHGRGRVFDAALIKQGIKSKLVTRKCLSIYRLHLPTLKLPEVTINCLSRLKIHPLFIVTDGNKIVQKNKVLALGVQNMVDKVFITHNYGLKNSKPSTYCFEKIQQLTKSDREDIFYIGDNPKKDFVNIKKLGYKTVRIRQGAYANLVVSVEHDAHSSINSLDELTLEFTSKII